MVLLMNKIKRIKKNKSLLVINNKRIFRKCRIIRKHFYSMYDCIIHYRDWMFFDNELVNIEIAKPTLENIEMMKRLGLDYVVKGFKNFVEYRRFDRIRIEYGVSTMMFISRCVGNKFIASALTDFMNGESLPSKDEIDSEIDDHRLTDMNDDIAVKRMNEREMWKRKNALYSVIIHRMMYDLIKQGRVFPLEFMV